MPTSEPFGTALLLATAGALMTASVLFSRASQRIGVPIALLFLLIGCWPAPRASAGSRSTTIASPSGWARSRWR
jgi:NhaP-type Na+/H+ and K+/H+ antiporters with a unique C-terminal domain